MAHDALGGVLSREEGARFVLGGVWPPAFLARVVIEVNRVVRVGCRGSIDQSLEVAGGVWACCGAMVRETIQAERRRWPYHI